MVACAVEGALPIFAEGPECAIAGQKWPPVVLTACRAKARAAKEASCCLDFLVTFLSRKK
jgi:hypothetical protein